jgi:pimeloyl-ACP methyl ester carboxylesterase
VECCAARTSDARRAASVAVGCRFAAVSSAESAASATRAIERWSARGRRVPTPDGALWVLDEPGTDPAATPLLLLHGFPSSAFDFEKAIAHLGSPRRRRIVALDFLGYGLSDKPARSVRGYRPGPSLTK